MLKTIVHGTASGLPTLLIAHGLFGSARNWGAVAARLATRRQVVVVDMRNHGDSPWFDSHTYRDMAGDLSAVLDTVGQADVLGHSMGGKAAMVLALTRPAQVRRLVIADISPVAYAHSHQVYIDAMRALPLAGLTGRGQADRLLAPQIPDAAVRAFLLQSLSFATSPPEWRLNLSVLQRDMPKITGWPAISAGFAGPVLSVRGALSDYVGPQHHDMTCRLFPAARFATIAAAGHWLHAEQPRAFEQVVTEFLA